MTMQPLLCSLAVLFLITHFSKGQSTPNSSKDYRIEVMGHIIVVPWHDTGPYGCLNPKQLAVKLLPSGINALQGCGVYLAKILYRFESMSCIYP